MFSPPVAAVVVAAPHTAHAYIGAGAGITAFGTVIALEGLGAFSKSVVGFGWYQRSSAMLRSERRSGGDQLDVPLHVMIAATAIASIVLFIAAQWLLVRSTGERRSPRGRGACRCRQSPIRISGTRPSRKRCRAPQSSCFERSSSIVFQHVRWRGPGVPSSRSGLGERRPAGQALTTSFASSLGGTSGMEASIVISAVYVMLTPLRLHLVNYSALEGLLHRIAFGAPAIQLRRHQPSRARPLAPSMTMSEPRPPIFGTSLTASSASRCCSKHGSAPLAVVGNTQLSRHAVRPWHRALWSRLSGSFRRQSELPDRAHGDGMQVDYDSPEAFEEVLWRAFWPEHHERTRDCARARRRTARTRPSALLRRAYATKRHRDRLDFDRLRHGRYISKNNGNISPPRPYRPAGFRTARAYWCGSETRLITHPRCYISTVGLHRVA